MPRVNTRSDSYEALCWDIVTNAHRYIPKPGDNVLDLGAHFGMFSLYCAARGCHVKAYEPGKDAIQELLHTVEVAKEIGLGDINANACALWNDMGLGFLVPRSESSAANSINSIFTPGADGEPVLCVTLRHAMEGKEWDCVKVDIEGAEYEVFSVADSYDFERIKFLTIEIHNDLLPKAQREELLVKLIGAFPEHYMIPVKVNGQPTGDVATLVCWR